MTKSKTDKNTANFCATNDTKCSMYYIKNQILRYMELHDMSQDEFAEYAGISTHTLHSIIYKGLDDCKLSTAIAIAKAIGIGVDELANTGAMPDISLESVRISRNLPEHVQLLIRRYIRWQQSMHEKFKNHPGKFIDVMNLDYENDHLKTSNDMEKVDISEFPTDLKAKCFRGVRIPCDEYIEFYRENDILILADDRKPRGRERCVILYFNRVFIVQKATQDGVNGYRRIRDTTFFVPENEVEYYFGYVAGVKHG